MAMLTIVLSIVLFIVLINTSRQIKELKNQILINKKNITEIMNDVYEGEETLATAETVTQVVEQAQCIAPPKTVAIKTQILASQQHTGSRFLQRAAINRPMKLGAAIFFLGLVWGITYAFSHGWIGPSMRIVIGLLVGMLLIGLGRKRFAIDADQATILSGLGGGSVLISLFLGNTIFGFFNPEQLLGYSFCIAILLTWIALQKQSNKLVYIALLLGGIGPLIARSLFTNTGLSFAYLTVLAVGTIALAYQTHREHISSLWLIVYGCYSAPFLLGVAQTTTTMSLAIAGVFFLLYYGAQAIHLYTQQPGRKPVTQGFGALMTYLNALLAILWVVSTSITEATQAMIVLLIGIIPAVLSGIAYMQQAKETIIHHLIVALVCLLIATALYYDGNALAIAYRCELLLLVSASLWIVRKPILSQSLLWLLLLPLALSGQAIASPVWQTAWWHPDAVVVIVGWGCCLALLLQYLIYKPTESTTQKYNRNTKAWYIITAIGGWGVISLALQHLGAEQAVWTLLAYSTWLGRACLNALSLPDADEWLPNIAYLALGLLVYVPGIVHYDVWGERIVHLPFVAMIYTAIVCLCIALLYIPPQSKGQKTAYLLFSTAATLLTVYVWRQSSQAIFANDHTAHMVALITIAICAIAGYIRGNNHRRVYLKQLSAAAIIGVVIRLVIIDVRALKTERRIVTFIVIGALLLSSPYFLHKHDKNL